MLLARDLAAEDFAPVIDLPSRILDGGTACERKDAVPSTLPELACPDLPPLLGVLIAASYVAILGAFLLVFSESADVVFIIGVCGVYLAAYLSVPAIMFRIEGRGRSQKHPDFAAFLERGLITWTGHVSGSGAILQILLIPAAVTGAVLGIGLIIGLSR
jgi:hypothetical protein